MPYDYFDPRHGTLARRLDVAFEVYFSPPLPDQESQMRAR
ncbi:Uncharacterised protein [Legionella waltersii]|nr:Uncharacterised protein [Legionella waltersii]